jgi:hypothetical protein
MRKSSFYWSFIVCYASLLATNLAALAGEFPENRRSEVRNSSTTESVEVRDFEVRVDNKPAGTHRLTIKSEGDTHEVAFQTDVKMDFIVYAYVFKFRGTEVWRDGRLENADIRCEDGGKKRSFSLKTDGRVQQISFNGKEVPASSLGLMTTAYWRLPPADSRKKPLTIVDVDSGNTRNATLNIVGKTTISSAGQTLECRHFKIDGPSPAELWFDDQDRLVRQKSVEVGHQLELKLKDIRIPKNVQ